MSADIIRHVLICQIVFKGSYMHCVICWLINIFHFQATELKISRWIPKAYMPAQWHHCFATTAWPMGLLEHQRCKSSHYSPLLFRRAPHKLQKCCAWFSLWRDHCSESHREQGSCLKERVSGSYWPTVQLQKPLQIQEALQSLLRCLCSILLPTILAEWFLPISWDLRVDIQHNSKSHNFKSHSMKWRWEMIRFWDLKIKRKDREGLSGNKGSQRE